jgi:hypothetical protein
MGVFDKLQNGGGASAPSGGVFSRINQQIAYNNARGAAEEDEQQQIERGREAMLAETQPQTQQQATNDFSSDPSRSLPVIGPILRGVDAIASNPIVSKIGEIGREFFVPGASVANIASFAGAVENGVSRLLPGLADSALGRVAQKAASEAAVGAPLGAGQSLYTNPDESAGETIKQGLVGAGMGAGLGVFGKLAGAGLGSLADRYAGTKIGDALGRLIGREISPHEQTVQGLLALPQPEQRLALPEGNPDYAYNRPIPSQSGTREYAFDNPIPATGDVYTPPTLALPQSNYVQQKLKIVTGDDLLGSVLNKIKPEVEAAITPPTRRDLLINYIQDHLQVPREEIHNMPMKDLQELGQEIRKNVDVYGIASRTAAKYGYDLPALLEGKSPSIASRIAEDAQKRVYGIYPDSVVKLKKPSSFARSVTGEVAAPIQKGFRSIAKPNNVDVKLPQRNFATSEPKTATETAASQKQPVFQRLTQQEYSGQPETTSKAANERGFTNTVRTSEKTPEPLKQAFSEPQLYKTRSTQKLFEDAQKFIEKHGQQGAYDFVMNAKKMTDRHNAVAQILSKQLANSGDISRAIDVVSKTAKSGTELGRAIQALSLWNRMDTEGALLLAQRQLNKNAIGGEYRTLTPEQAKPIVAATEKIQQVEKAKNLADEVLNIVSNKQPGEKLSDAEITKIKQFQAQVNEINSKVKGFLPDKATRARKIIEEVNKIPPENRTIDQLRDYWEARAERARQKLAKQRNIGLLPNTENPVLLYAELGVAKIAKGALDLADFTDQMVREFGEKVRPIINQVYNQSLNMFRKSQGLPTTNELNQVVSRAVKERALDPETAAKFKNWANQIAFYTDENLRTEAVQDLQLALRRLEKSTLGQKISSLQAGAQLLSLPTTVRNVIGNEAFNVLEKINKITAIPIDWAVSRFTGERTIIFNPQNQEKYWSNWFKGAQAGWKGVSPNGKLSSYDIRPEVFGERNPLKYITKLTGAELQSFDHAAYMRAYGDVLATYAEQLGKSQGLSGKALKEAIPILIKQLDQSIYDIAEEAGRYATFQDDTWLSKAAEAIKKGLNYPTKLIGDAAVKAGILPEIWNPSGFGLGDIVLKYAKTPANIIMRAIDYSPIGILRGIMQIAPLLTGREFNQRQAVLALSRGITGTLGLTGLGYYLASQGILTGAPSSDKDVKALYDAAGQKGYQVNISALKRWLMSGLDKNAAKYQNGDTLINYDWLQPMAISLAAGVNMNQAQNEKKAGVTKTAAQIAGSMILSGLKTVMQQPLVQGVQQVSDAAGQLFKQGSWSGVWNIFKGVPASFVPAISGQIRNFTDNTARSTYDPSALKSMINMVINKIPGLDKQLPPQIGSLGDVKQQVEGGEAGTAKQAFNVFLNPAKVSSYNISPEAAMVVQLINDTGDARVAPRVPNRYLMVNKQKIDLTPEQYTQLQQQTSQYTADHLRRISPMLTNPNVPDQRKIDAVIKVLNDAGDKARKQLERQYPELKPKKVAK